MTRHRFPQTSSPRMIAKLIRQGILQNARFAAAVLVKGVKRGKKEDQHLLIRSDCTFPRSIRFGSKDDIRRRWRTRRRCCGTFYKILSA